MLQADTSLPDVPRHPAPWDLQGQGWVVAMRLPAASPARSAFLPEPGTDTPAGALSLLMFVDYATSDCGPYHELLFIPGAQRFADGRRHMTISRILVSTWDSVVNGRANWGIPKDRADFTADYAKHRGEADRIAVRDPDGREIAALTLRAWPLSLPMHGGLVPARFRTLAQRMNGKTFLYAPGARGWIRPGRVLDWHFNAELFPDLAGAQVIAAVKIPAFRMNFPLATVLPGT